MSEEPPSAANPAELTDVRRSSDPTKAILSKSDLNKKYLCDYVINVATGCSHGCRFCYVPSTPNIRARPDMLNETVDVEDPQQEWGSYVLYRDHIPDELPGILDRKQKWETTDRGRGVVGISFGTDCYMDPRAGDITTATVEALTSRDRYARILTRNPVLASRDMETFREAGENVIVGSSINSLDPDTVGAIEINAPGPQQRLRGLQKFAENDVPVYVSMSPTYPTMGEQDIRELMESLAELDPRVIFHEPINPRGGNFQMTVDAAWAAGEDEFGASLAKLRDEETWVEYALTHFYWVQKIGEELELPVHLWPDKQLINAVDEEYKTWLKAWFTRQSPEEFAGRETPDTPMPELPSRPY
jgi:DNA repair photolyase